MHPAFRSKSWNFNISIYLFFLSRRISAELHSNDVWYQFYVMPAFFGVSRTGERRTLLTPFCYEGKFDG